MKAIGKLVLGAVLLAGATAVAAPAAEAAWYGGYGHGPGYGRPGAQFGFGAGPAWRGGRWNHGWHGPRYGWWWTVGNSWYLYPRPVYPYPAYLPPPGASADGYYDDRPPPRDYAQGYQSDGAGNPQRPDYWYFCESPEGYYPYVQDCDNWLQEPAEGPRPPGNYPEYDDPDFQRQ
jgi:hypothetical protein